MAGGFASASSQYLIGGSTPITAVPLTMSGWFTAVDVATNYVLCSLSVNGGSHRFQLVPAGATVGDPISGSSIGATAATANSTAGFTAGPWYHGAFVTSSITSRDAFLDGGNKGSDTTSMTPVGIDRLLIGARIATTVGGFLNGNAMEVGFWNAALTDAEIASLGKGFSPKLVRPQSLLCYARLIRDFIDVARALTLTNTGGVTVSAHNRVYG